jgi:hypothetical protein
MNVVGNSHIWHVSATNEFWKFLRKYSKCSGVITSGVSNIDYNNKFEIYPNPTNSTIFIKKPYISPFQFSIFDAMGQVIMRGRLNGNSIDVSSLLSGIYFIRLKDEKGQWFKSKFIKE